MRWFDQVHWAILGIRSVPCKLWLVADDALAAAAIAREDRGIPIVGPPRTWDVSAIADGNAAVRAAVPVVVPLGGVLGQFVVERNAVEDPLVTVALGREKPPAFEMGKLPGWTVIRVGQR